ncbi:MAG TPA: hypothetical protein VGB70_12365 [Allosphingosinicella sp.]|jgi:hypothetical protein
MRAAVTLLLPLACLGVSGALHAGELSGPGRFCGYSPIIDLLPGERVITGKAGIHAGEFVWQGAFGKLEVKGIGWAGRPTGIGAAGRTAKGLEKSEPRRERGGYVVALWNGRNAAAYFFSPRRLTRAQLTAIDRVDLYQEGEEPEGCKLRTAFSWE